MKKLFLFAVILFAGVSVANAQEVTSTATLNVNLKGIQTITVLADQKNVNLNYLEEADYTSGVTLPQPDHLKVSSTGGFFVTVSATENKLTRAAGGEISGETITITPSAGTSNALGTATYLASTLATPEVNIISSGTGGFGKNFSIEYKGGADYIDKYIAGDVTSVYTTTVTYTLTAK